MSSSGLATGTGDAAEQEAQYVKGRDAQDIYYWHGGDHQSYFDQTLAATNWANRWRAGSEIHHPNVAAN
jgi:hypothetical protein